MIAIQRNTKLKWLFKEKTYMNLIVAVDNNWGIGKKNQLLYNIKADMTFFRKQTLNKVVVMGEKTFNSFPQKKPLKNRINIVLSDDVNFNVQDCTVVHTLEDMFDEIKKYNEDDVYLIGGASLYNLLLPYCKRAYVTKINSSKDADKFITNIDTLKNWIIENETDECLEGEYSFKFVTYKNLKVKKF